LIRLAISVVRTFLLVATQLINLDNQESEKFPVFELSFGLATSVKLEQNFYNEPRRADSCVHARSIVLLEVPRIFFFEDRQTRKKDQDSDPKQYILTVTVCNGI
jgi:hypothetical protein